MPKLNPAADSTQATSTQISPSHSDRQAHADHHLPKIPWTEDERQRHRKKLERLGYLKKKLPNRSQLNIPRGY